jgi:hypothetical protein
MFYSGKKSTLFMEAIAFVAPFMAPATAVFACMAYIPTHFSNKFEQKYKSYHRPTFIKEAESIVV